MRGTDLIGVDIQIDTHVHQLMNRENDWERENVIRDWDEGLRSIMEGRE